MKCLDDYTSFAEFLDSKPRDFDICQSEINSVVEKNDGTIILPNHSDPFSILLAQASWRVQQRTPTLQNAINEYLENNFSVCPVGNISDHEIFIKEILPIPFEAFNLPRSCILSNNNSKPFLIVTYVGSFGLDKLYQFSHLAGISFDYLLVISFSSRYKLSQLTLLQRDQDDKSNLLGVLDTNIDKGCTSSRFDRLASIFLTNNPSFVKPDCSELSYYSEDIGAEQDFLHGLYTKNWFNFSFPVRFFPNSSLILGHFDLLGNRTLNGFRNNRSRHYSSPHYTKNIILTGGSTPYCSELPYESCLEAKLSHATNSNVHNIGGPAEKIANEYSKLVHCLIHQKNPQFVCSVSGFNNLYNPFLIASPSNFLGTNSSSVGVTQILDYEKFDHDDSFICKYFIEYFNLFNDLALRFNYKHYYFFQPVIWDNEKQVRKYEDSDFRDKYAFDPKSYQLLKKRHACTQGLIDRILSICSRAKFSNLVITDCRHIFKDDSSLGFFDPMHLTREGCDRLVALMAHHLGTN